jgi:hypothetical protein
MRRSGQSNPLHSSPVAQAVAACLFSGAVLFSCNTSDRAESGVEHIEEFDGDTTVFEGASSFTNLTQAEWEIHRSDRAYVRSLVPPMTPVSLNLADERQHRFVLLRLKLAGKTPDDSPQLFEQLEDMRVQHERLGYTTGTLAAIDATPSGSAPHGLSSGGNDPVSTISDNSASRSSQHAFSSLDILPNGEDDPVAQEVLATVSALEDAYYSFVDVGAWDKNGTPLGNMDWLDAYGPMPFTTVATQGNLTLATRDELEADSFVWQDRVGAAPRNSYMVGPQRRGPQFDPPVITGPVDSVGGECIDICLNRAWTGDCDYDLTGTPTALKIPLAGCISLDSPASANSYSFNQTQITSWASSGCNDDCGQIRVTLQDVGGGCNVDQDSSIYGSMQQFYQRVTLSNGGDTLCWDMTGANAMMFDPSCRQVQDSVELTMNLTLPWQHNGGLTGVSTISLTNNDQSATPDFPCITVTNSCLAEGTMIELASGQPVAIEAIEAGVKAASPYGSGGLTVMDTAKGTEDVPMVRIEDEAGRTLLLTTKHPILVTGRGMVQAEDLKAGDSVETKMGPSRLVAVSREAFDGNVHNLKVASDIEANSLKPDQTVLYANGFVVGDGQIQSKYESIEMAAKKKVDIRGFLPDYWMEDYKNSARRAARSKAR